MRHPTAKLALEDGTVYTGTSFGAVGETAGEVVFNTSLSGYQEVLTDPSYRGQIVTMTYPMIGNTGINEEDKESPHPQVQGFIVREADRRPSNYRSESSLQDYLSQNRIPGIEGIDTRSLVRRLRVRGSMNGILSSICLDDAELVKRAKATPGMLGRDLVKEVVPEKSFVWKNGGLNHLLTKEIMNIGKNRRRIVAMDFGMKWNILRCLTHVGCEVTVVPGTASASEVMKHEPEGIFLSNGPGDPAALGPIIENISQLCSTGKPIFGICLGHQLLGHALGGTTFKLKFGHRGANQPVLNKLTNQVEITTQNHGFAVDLKTLPKDVEATHINLNDQTLEGLRHKTKPIFCVQYHPEAAAGPHDSMYLFGEFMKLMN
ncbi:MAG TPA: glutamine-hydrolyzing carbamoyl-phosphate synthase small subunit [Gemmatales bacterium]|nr:glutamine-hydrolyzing carbamoyl-phosphate synthase small subunit [Gemmatales bacterium]